MTKRSKTILIFVACLGCACSAFAAISQQSYSMKGDLVWSVGTNTVRVPTVILRDGKTIKLTQITEPADPAKYQAAVYLSTPDVAVNFTQFGEDITFRCQSLLFKLFLSWLQTDWKWRLHAEKN